jgi:hypothetical protein
MSECLPQIDANRKLEDTPGRVSLIHPKPCTLYGHDYKIFQFLNVPCPTQTVPCIAVHKRVESNLTLLTAT